MNETNGINEPTDINQGNARILSKNQSIIIWNSDTNLLVDRHKIVSIEFEFCLRDQPTNMIQTSPERRQKSRFQESSDNKRLQESFEIFFQCTCYFEVFFHPGCEEKW